MANPNDPLIHGHSHDHLPPVKQEQPSPPFPLLQPSLPSTAAMLQLNQQQQLEERGQLVRAVKSEPTQMEFPTSQSQETKQHQFIKSIGDLAALSAAIDAFKRQYDDLQKHVEFIQKAIDSKLNGGGVGGDIGASSSFSRLPRVDAVIPGAGIPLQESAGMGTETAKKPEAERFCELMCSKGLRRYISANLSDTAKLMEEIPAALKLAKKPAKLVLDCIGRFYLQGSKAFTHDSPMIPARKVSLLILECFLLMSCRSDAEIESSVKAEAETAAVAWRKRLMAEGGLARAEQMDARGLLLLISGFGVPSNFRNEDLLDLIRQSNPVGISGALRRSAFLVPIIPGMIDSIMKQGLHIEAVDLVYTFGLEDKFSAPSILTAFLRMNKETFERAKHKAYSTMALKEANEKQLTALISVVRCLETRRLDPAKVLPGWQIKDQMIKLEKEIFVLDQVIEEKARSIRLMEEVVLAQRLYNQELKRPRLSGVESPLASSSYSPILHDQRFPRLERDEISALVSSYLGLSSSIPCGSSLGSSHENVAAAALGRGVSAYEPHTGYIPPGSYSPVHGSGWYPPVHRPGSYSPVVHGQSGLSGQQPLFGLQRHYRQTLSVEGSAGLPNDPSTSNLSSDRYGFTDAAQ